MEEAFKVFVNGFAGVFCGMAILYLVIKLLSFAAGKAEKSGE